MRSAIAAAVVVAGLAVVACGGDDDSSGDDITQAETRGTTVNAESSEPAEVNLDDVGVRLEAAGYAVGRPKITPAAAGGDEPIDLLTVDLNQDAAVYIFLYGTPKGAEAAIEMAEQVNLPGSKDESQVVGARAYTALPCGALIDEKESVKDLANGSDLVECTERNAGVDQNVFEEVIAVAEGE